MRNKEQSTQDLGFRNQSVEREDDVGSVLRSAFWGKSRVGLEAGIVQRLHREGIATEENFWGACILWAVIIIVAGDLVLFVSQGLRCESWRRDWSVQSRTQTNMTAVPCVVLYRIQLKNRSWDSTIRDSTEKDRHRSSVGRARIFP